MANPNNPFVVSWDFWKDVISGDTKGNANAERIAQNAYEADKRAGATEDSAQKTKQLVYKQAVAGLYPDDNPWQVFIHLIPLLLFIGLSVYALHVLGGFNGLKGLIKELKK